MSLNILSSSPLRLFRQAPTLAAPARAACRWNSTESPEPSMPRMAPRSTPHDGHQLPQRRRREARQRFFNNQRSQNENRALERHQSRNWEAGDIYAPHDLSPSEMRKWKKRQSPPTDAFDALDLNPLDLYKNFSIMSEYMTPMGRIKHRNQTGLRPVNQRRLAKAIRRAIGMGLMPSVHRHPEILADEAKGRMEGSSM